MLHDFELAGKKVRLWQRNGESFEHILLKALGYAMFVWEFPSIEIEKKVGLRYKPDLVAQSVNGNFEFWGECGANSLRKTAWLLKHAGVEKLVLFKLSINLNQFVAQLREEIEPRYRAGGKLVLINFVPQIVELTKTKRIGTVLPEWFAQIVI